MTSAVMTQISQKVMEESVLDILKHRRIDFHKATRPSTAVNPQLKTFTSSSNVDKKTGSLKSSLLLKGSSSSSASEDSSAQVAAFQRMYDWTFIRKVGPGLSNMGNTCYLNSVLQCLTYTPLFAQWLISNPPHHANGLFHSTQFMEKHVRQIFSKQQKHSSVRPHALVSNIRRVARHFRPGRQEDAHEFLRLFLQSMEPQRNKGLTKPTKKTFIDEIFGGTLKSRVACADCPYVSDTFQPFLDLSLELTKGVESIELALRHYTMVEKLDAVNAWKCSGCHRRTRASKSLVIGQAPPVLILQLKRFANSWGRGKINKHIAFPELLDVSRYSGSASSKPKSKRNVYQLHGVLVHAGHSTNNGHYYAFVRDSTGSWYEMNDDYVTLTSLKQVLKQQAYMLFYSKRLPMVKPPKVVNHHPTPKDITTVTVVPSTPTSSSLSQFKAAIVLENNNNTTPTTQEAEAGRESPQDQTSNDELSSDEGNDTTAVCQGPVFTGGLGKFSKFSSNSWASYSMVVVAPDLNSGALTTTEKSPLVRTTSSQQSVMMHLNPRTSSSSSSLYGKRVSQWQHHDEETDRENHTPTAQEQRHHDLLRELARHETKHQKKGKLDAWDSSLDVGKQKKIRHRRAFCANEGRQNSFQAAHDQKKQKKKRRTAY